MTKRERMVAGKVYPWIDEEPVEMRKQAPFRCDCGRLNAIDRKAAMRGGELKACALS
ncbi:MAG: hypothetical protein ACPGKS_02865 [Coraliomargarita sp.]